MLNNFLCLTPQPITIHFIQFPSLLSSLLKKKNRKSFRSVPNFSFSCLSLSQSCLRKSGQGVGRLSEWFQCSAEQHKWKRMRLAVELIPWGKTITSRKTWLDHTNTHSWRTQKHTHTHKHAPSLSVLPSLMNCLLSRHTHTTLRCRILLSFTIFGFKWLWKQKKIIIVPHSVWQWCSHLVLYSQHTPFLDSTVRHV